MKLNFSIVPAVFLTLLWGCQGGVGTEEIDFNDVVEISADQVKSSLASVEPKLVAPEPVERRETVIPEVTSTTCGYNTKSCNIGFGELKVSIYDTIWYISTPKATVLETFRKKKSDKDEEVSMVATIRSFNTYFNVYITGTLYNGGCINDKNNKCALDVFLNEKENNEDISFYLRNIEDKTPKLVRFKYSDWTGKCYKTWELKFDIQATKKDLTDWYWFGRFDMDAYYP